MEHRVEIVEADLARAEHQRDVLALTAAYALDPMGEGTPLPPEVLDRLIDGLKTHPTTLIFLAYLGAEAVGIATCFRGFSTFRAATRQHSRPGGPPRAPRQRDRAALAGSR